MPNNFASAQELVTIEEIKNDTVIVKGGGLRQVLIVGGVNFSLKSETEQNIITAAYQNFLNSIDFPLQIIIHSRKLNIEKYLATLDDYKRDEASPLLQDQIAEYREFVSKFVSDNAIMAKTFLVVVPWSSFALPTKSSFLGFLPFMKKDNKAEEARAAEETQAHFEKDLAQLKQRVSRVAEGLAAIGLEVMALNNEQLVELFYNFYNPEAVEKEELHTSQNN